MEAVTPRWPVVCAGDAFGIPGVLCLYSVVIVLLTDLTEKSQKSHAGAHLF